MEKGFHVSCIMWVIWKKKEEGKKPVIVLRHVTSRGKWNIVWLLNSSHKLSKIKTLVVHVKGPIHMREE